MGATLIAFDKGLARSKRVDLITPGVADLSLRDVRNQRGRVGVQGNTATFWKFNP